MASTLSIREYQDFVATTYIPEKDCHYSLLRAGLELAEEYLEWYECSVSREIDELGDVLYWCAQIANLLNFKIDKEIEPTHDGFSLIILKIIGNIKRFYRDDKKESLAYIPQHINDLYAYIRNNQKYEVILQNNFEKLTRRKASGTLQGSGDR